MPEELRRISVSRVIDAPAALVFAFLADPANHQALDTSGMIRGYAGTAVITGVGQVFAMDMRNDFKGAHQVENHVVVHEPGLAVGWAPAEPGEEPAGHTYVWRLRPLADDRTEVTQVHDWSRFTHLEILPRLPVVNRDQLRASLDLLADALA